MFRPHTAIISCYRILIPKYAQIKIPHNNKAAMKTQKQTQTLRIKNEITEQQLLEESIL
jgi:hypothetical protein